MTHLLIALATALSISTASVTPVAPSDDGEVLHAVSGSVGLTGTRAEISWQGRGFLCLKTGNSCTVTIGIGLNVAADPQTYGMPAGSNVALIETVDGGVVPQGTPLSIGDHDVPQEDIRVIEGEPLPPGSTIFIPDQESVPDPQFGQLIYYFGG